MRVSVVATFAAAIVGSASMAQAQSEKYPERVSAQAGPSAPKAQAVPTTARAVTRLSEQAQIDILTAEVNTLKAQVSTMQAQLNGLPPGFLGENNCGAGGWSSGVSQLNPDALFYNCIPTHR